MKWHKNIFRVQYKETDRMDVVHHTNYVTWFERSRTECMRDNGIPYSRMEALGLLLPVLSVEVKYKRSAHFDDLIAVYTKVTAYSGVRLEFAYEVRKIGFAPATVPPNENNIELPEGELLATGSSTHMWVNKEWKPARMDREFPDIYKVLEEIAG